MKPAGGARRERDGELRHTTGFFVISAPCVSDAKPASHFVVHSRRHSTFSSAQHGSAAMLKPMIDIPLASLRCPPEALPGRPETADTVAAA